jgi:hypothetical protein
MNRQVEELNNRLTQYLDKWVVDPLDYEDNVATLSFHNDTCVGWIEYKINEEGEVFQIKVRVYKVSDPNSYLLKMKIIKPNSILEEMNCFFEIAFYSLSAFWDEDIL